MCKHDNEIKENRRNRSKTGAGASLSTYILGARLTLPYQLYPQCTAIQSEADPHPNFHLGWELQGAWFTPTEPPLCVCALWCRQQ
jgi:hypothetical protein